MYDLYKSWFKRTSPSGTVQGKSTFIKDLKNLIADDENWTYCDRTIRTKNMMDNIEMLIDEYGLTEWTNKSYTGNNRTNICKYAPLAAYSRCILRVTSNPQNP